MTTTTATLTEFLLARIAEDAATAQAADASHAWGNPYDDGTGIERTFTPARVLAECEAKRRIVALCVEAQDRMMQGPELHKDGTFHTVTAWMGQACRVLAEVYADHPDYRKEWRP